MYERLLDKNIQPSFSEFSEYCGARKSLFLEFDTFLLTDLGAARCLRFPYGNKYGWGLNYTLGRKHLCDLFAERDAFTVLLRMSNSVFSKVYPDLTPYARELIDHKYPCGEGGWVHFRVLEENHLADLKAMLSAAYRIR